MDNKLWCDQSNENCHNVPEVTLGRAFIFNNTAEEKKGTVLALNCFIANGDCRKFPTIPYLDR